MAKFKVRATFAGGMGYESVSDGAAALRDRVLATVAQSDLQWLTIVPLPDPPEPAYRLSELRSGGWALLRCGPGGETNQVAVFHSAADAAIALKAFTDAAKE